MSGVLNIEAAINYLGTSTIKNLVLSMEVFSAFKSDDAAPGFSFDDQQNHSLLVASISRKLMTDQHLAEDAFMAGMLHDIGKLILATRFPGPFSRALATSQKKSQSSHLAERELMEVTHAEIGAYLLGLWGLPYTIVEAVAFHHAPANIPQHCFEVLGAVYVANILAHEQTPPRPGVAPDVHDELDLAYLEALGVSDRLPVWRQMATELAAGGDAQ